MCPDITMCNGDNCPVKKKCYRYTAKPSEYQSYFVESPIKDGKCDHYWEYVNIKIDKKKKK